MKHVERTHKALGINVQRLWGHVCLERGLCESVDTAIADAEKRGRDAAWDAALAIVSGCNKDLIDAIRAARAKDGKP